MKKPGRKERFDVSPWLEGEGKEKLIEWAGNGLSYKDIADQMGLSLSGLGKVRRKYPELNDILQKAREKPDKKVENALYRRCLGMEVKETTYSYRVKADGAKICTNVREVIKEIPPDVQSIIFYLRCRMPQIYNPDKIAQTIDPDSVGVIEIPAADFPVAEVSEEIRKTLPLLSDDD